jgi:hypothetical protein
MCCSGFRNDDYDQVLELWEIEPNDDFGCKGLNDRKSTFEEQYPNGELSSLSDQYFSNSFHVTYT